MKRIINKTGIFGLFLILFLFVSCLPMGAKNVQAATGFVTEGGKTYYYKADGSKYTGWLTLNGNKYYFYKGSGIMATGWVTNGEGQKRYFYKGSGIMATGWVTNGEGQKRYFYKGSGVMATGWVSNASGDQRYFDPSTGIMSTGWVTYSSGQKRYFYTGSGIMATGWVKNGKGESRYFDPSTGIMATGWLTLNGTKYYFYTGSGIMATGWVKNGNGDYRYFKSTGAMVTGWQTIDGKKYWFNTSNGIRAKGWNNSADGSYRYFDPSTGVMVTGWLTLNGNKYYLNTSTGVRTTGTITLSGIQYTFNSSGVLTSTYDPSQELIQAGSGKTIKNYLANALLPVGKALYVWGGGWGNSTTKGVPQSMIDFYNSQTSSYDFNNYRDGSAETRAKGFDCSGFIGWAAYQVMHTKSGEGYGYTEWSGDVGPSYAAMGWGTVMPEATLAANGYIMKPGDVGYNYNHTWMILGQCSDKSCVIIHSTNDAGVQIAGTPTPSGNYLSEAITLAKKYMSQYPGYNKYYYHTSSGKYVGPSSGAPNDYFRWNRSTLADPDGYMNMTAGEILYDLFGF